MLVSPELAKTVVDPTAYADGRIHETFTRLRRESPVARVETEGYDPFWVVTRHADILEAERRNTDFSSGQKMVTLTTKEALARAESTGLQMPKTWCRWTGPST